MSPSTFDGPALADTSVFIAREGGREMNALPAMIAVSVVTLGELQLGVLAANDRAIRAQRAGTLSLARIADPLPITEGVMMAWAHLIDDCRKAGFGHARVNDSLIAATAIDNGLPVVTQDADFDELAKAHPRLDVIRV